MALRGENTSNSTREGVGIGEAGDASFTLQAAHGHAVAWSIMPMNSGKDYKARATDVAQPIMAGGPVGGNQGGDFIVQPVAFAQNTRDEVRIINGDGAVAGALAAEPGMKQQTYIAFLERMSATAHASSENLSPALGAKNPTAAAFDMRGRKGGAQFEGPHETANIRAASGGSSRSYVAQTSAVRRLTPVECEKLQGFPSGFTAIPYRNKPAYACPDGPRYKALGNSMAVPVMRWIGERIQMVEDLNA
jgi:site-specific DNA-cytosine methylase